MDETPLSEESKNLILFYVGEILELVFIYKRLFLYQTNLFILVIWKKTAQNFSHQNYIPIQQKDIIELFLNLKKNLK